MAARRRVLPVALLMLASAPRAEVFEGLYVSGPGGGEFGPCRTGWFLRVTGNDTVLEQLQAAYARVARVPHESVYVWFEGRKEGARPGSSGDYDGSFTLSAVRLLRRSIPEDCVLPADPSADDLDYLFTMVERMPDESGLFGSEPLHGRLRTLMGEDYPLLLDNMRIQGPLSRAGGLLYAEGTGADPGEAAVFMAAPGLGRLTVILVTGGSVRQYAGDDEPLPPPPAVRRFLEIVRDDSP